MSLHSTQIKSDDQAQQSPISRRSIEKSLRSSLLNPRLVLCRSSSTGLGKNWYRGQEGTSSWWKPKGAIPTSKSTRVWQALWDPQNHKLTTGPHHFTGSSQLRQARRRGCKSTSSISKRTKRLMQRFCRIYPACRAILFKVHKIRALCQWLKRLACSTKSVSQTKNSNLWEALQCPLCDLKLLVWAPILKCSVAQLAQANFCYTLKIHLITTSTCLLQTQQGTCRERCRLTIMQSRDIQMQGTYSSSHSGLTRTK